MEKCKKAEVNAINTLSTKPQKGKSITHTDKSRKKNENEVKPTVGEARIHDL